MNPCEQLKRPGPVRREDCQAADTVFMNGNIYTMAGRDFHATAMAVSGQTLQYVGDDGGARAHIGRNTRVEDLKGRTVIPGIIESHLHFTAMGAALLDIDAFWKSKEDILAVVRATAARLKPGEWITGRGWNQEIWNGGRFPTCGELDAVAPANPVVLTRACGHMIWVNSLALTLAGISNDTANPVGGEYLRTDTGEMIGVITDTAMQLVTGLIPPLTGPRMRESISMAQSLLFSHGVTSAVDAGVDRKTLGLMRDLYHTGDLSVRLYAMVEAESAEAFYQSGPESGLYGGRLDIRCIKFMNDGSLGARSAWMLSDYSDRDGHAGNGRYTDEELCESFHRATAAGFQVAAHSIGDAANRQTIDAWERVCRMVPDGDYR
ncbi:MAG: amidohydrolase family protein, partial [Clostridia bacterium]|nr:amidohydrolase family protein [Clostridia bacterium]